MTIASIFQIFSSSYQVVNSVKLCSFGRNVGAVVSHNTVMPVRREGGGWYRPQRTHLPARLFPQELNLLQNLGSTYSLSSEVAVITLAVLCVHWAV